MALLTPPSSGRKQKKTFMEPSNTFTYYEEIYGERDEDEVDDNSDLCEDETDSDDDNDDERDPSGALIARRGRSVLPGSFKGGLLWRYGNIRGAGQRPSFKNNNNGANNSESHQSKIGVSVNSKRSIPVRQTKKLAPKKFGLFSTPISKMGDMNTAGEAMDDLFGTAGVTSLGDLNNGFQTPDYDSDEELVLKERTEKPAFDPSLIDPELLAGAAEYLEQTGSGGHVALASDGVPGHSEFEADVEDNTSVTNDASEVTVAPNSQPQPAVVAVKSSKPKANIAKTRARAQDSSSSGRYSTRHQQRVKEAETSAKRRVTRFQGTKAKPTPAEIKAKNKNMMAARAAKVKKQVKKHGKKKAVGKSTGGLRNWRGEAIDSSGYVSVDVNEVDASEYTKC